MKQNSVTMSLIYKFSERLAVKGLGLVVSIILARLIAPEIHGLLAIVMVFINLAQTFVQSGMSTALVQNKTTSAEDYSTVLYLSLGIAAAMNVILYFCAPLIARLYESEMLIRPLRVLALSLFFGAFNSVQTAKLQREMRFRVMMLCNLVIAAVAGSIAIVCALCGLGLWALVIYQMAHVILVSLCMMAVDSWRPRLVFSPQRARVMFGFGWKMLVSALLTSLYNELRTLIIGLRYTRTDLAYYNKGSQFPHTISYTLDMSIQSVMLPVLSRAQDDKERLRELLMKTIRLSTFVVTPVMLGLAAVADTLIPLLLGEAWTACIPLLSLFCFADLVLPLRTGNLSLLKAIGRSDIYMKTEMVRRIVMVIILFITVFCFRSVMAIAAGYALNSVLDAYIVTVAVRRQVQLSWTKQVLANWKTLLAAAVMYALVYLMHFLPLPALPLLLLQIVSGAAVYALLSFLLGNEALAFLLNKARAVLYRR